MNRSITIAPAFGRDYASKAKALAAWDDNKDFVIHDLFIGGRYVNKQQREELIRDGITTIMLRYNNMRMVVVLKLK